MEQNKIRILLVDDCEDTCTLLCEHFEQTETMYVVGVAHNGIDGYAMFRDIAPDVVLLNLIMPFMDGIGFIDQVYEDNCRANCKIIVMSGVQDDRIINNVLFSGADYYIVKPLDCVQVEKRIIKLMQGYHKLPQKQKKQEEPLRNSGKKPDIQGTIARLLMDSGLPVHTLGYKYFQSALQYLVQQENSVFSITKTIYPYIAVKYETSSACVDKAMRHSLNLAYQENQQMLRYFLSQMNYHDCNDKPTNSEYLNLSMERIKQEVSGMHQYQA